MKRFEVWLVNLDPSKGAEMEKTRPAVIVSNDIINKHLETVIVVPLTSSIRMWPTRVNTDFENNGGQIALDQIRTVDKARLTKKIGQIDEEEGVGILLVLQAMFSV